MQTLRPITVSFTGKTPLTRRTLTCAVSAALLALAIACASRDEPAKDSVAVVAASPALTNVSPRAPSDTCEKNGLWSRCTIERRLKQSGFVVTRLDTAEKSRAGFSVKPVVYSLGRSRLEVFIYKSQSAASHDASLLDTVAVAPKGTATTWEIPPMFIRNTNMLAILITDNARQAERASLALTAGPPQKGSSR
jgi:hypothetical protein